MNVRGFFHTPCLIATLELQVTLEQHKLFKVHLYIDFFSINIQSVLRILGFEPIESNSISVSQLGGPNVCIDLCHFI